MPKVQSQVFVRPPWERMMRFHNLVKNGEYPNCSTLANEFEVSVRTIMRDVDFMKYRLDLPLEFDGDTPVLNYYQDWDINLTAGAWRKFDPARNLALNKTATASSATAPNVAANVTAPTTYENYTNFRWESDASAPQWIMVDLGSPQPINRVILKWHTNAAKEFRIQTSIDATAWTDVFTTTLGSANSVTDETFKTTSARYVRMYGTQRGTQNGYSLFSFMVLKD